MRTLWLALTAVLATDAAAQTFNLNGCWRNVRNDIGPCYIEQGPYGMWVTNEYGSRARAYFSGPYSIAVPGWSHATAAIAANGTILTWNGNGEWDLDPWCAPF
jgi:hypothetical protein